MKEVAGFVFLAIAVLLLSALLVQPIDSGLVSDPVFLFVYYFLDMPEWWMFGMVGILLLKGGLDQRKLVAQLNKLQQVSSSYNLENV